MLKPTSTIKETRAKFRQRSTTVPGQITGTNIITDSMVYCNSASRGGRRVKPVALLPRYGTASSYRISKFNNLQKGEFGYLWKTGTWREFSEWEIENQFTVADSSLIISEAEMLASLQNKIREEVMSSKAQAAVDLAELRKTKDMFASAASDLLHMYRDLRAGRPFAHFVKDMQKDGFGGTLGRRWLEYIYGWAPTIAGAYDTAEVLNKSFLLGDIVVGKVRVPTKTVSIPEFSIPYGRRSIVCRASARAVYQYTIKDPKLLQFSQLGFSNPLAIAWELLPWSFVLDWFVDVGGYINRMDFALGISDLYWQGMVRRKGYAYNVYVQSKDPSRLWLNQDTPIRSIALAQTATRTTPSNTVINSFKGLKNPFAVNETVRLTSAVALTQQQLKRINKYT